MVVKDFFSSPENVERFQRLVSGQRVFPDGSLSAEREFILNAIESAVSEFDTPLNSPDGRSKLDLLDNIHHIVSNTVLGHDFVANYQGDINSLLQPVWVRMAGESALHPHLFSAEFARYALSYLDSPYSLKHGHESMRKSFSEFMDKNRSYRFAFLAKKGAFDHELPESALNILVLEHVDTALPNVKEDSLKTIDLFEPSSRKPKGEGAHNPILGFPLLSDESLSEQIGTLRQTAEKDARDHRLYQDAQVLAQMEFNRRMREQPEFAHRTILFKIQDKILNGLTDFGNPITYPSESIFSESLARMDSNGRAAETLLHFRRGIVGPRVEFPNPGVTDEVYELAALNVRARGVSKPYINTTFRSPQQAIMFMERSVLALVNAGYHIDDISVAPHLKKAFDAYKETMAPRFEITETNEADLLNAPKSNRGDIPLSVAERIDVSNQQMNEAARSVGDDLHHPENPLKFSDLKHDDIIAVLNALNAHGSSNPMSWQEMQSQSGLSKVSFDTANEVKAEIGKLLERFDPENERFAPQKVGKNQLMLLSKLGLGVLVPLYGQPLMGRCFEHLTARSYEVQQEVAQDEARRQQESAPGPNGYPVAQETTAPLMPELNPPMEDGVHQPLDEIPPAPPLDDSYVELNIPAEMSNEPFMDDHYHLQDNPTAAPFHDDSVRDASTQVPEQLTAAEQPSTAAKLAVLNEDELGLSSSTIAQTQESVSHENLVAPTLVTSHTFSPEELGHEAPESTMEKGLEPDGWMAGHGDKLEEHQEVLSVDEQTLTDTSEANKVNSSNSINQNQLADDSSLTAERVDSLLKKAWFDFDQYDIRDALTIDDMSLHAMKYGDSSNGSTIEVAEKIQTIRDLVSPITNVAQLSASELKFLRSVPDDLLHADLKDAINPVASVSQSQSSIRPR